MKGIQLVSQILNDSGMLNLSKQVVEYERLRAAVQSALPPMLKSSVYTSPVNQGMLVLRCTNGTVHLKLRALAAQITDAVRAAGTGESRADVYACSRCATTPNTS